MTFMEDRLVSSENPEFLILKERFSGKTWQVKIAINHILDNHYIHSPKIILNSVDYYRDYAKTIIDGEEKTLFLERDKDKLIENICKEARKIPQNLKKADKKNYGIRTIKIGNIFFYFDVNANEIIIKTARPYQNNI